MTDATEVSYTVLVAEDSGVVRHYLTDFVRRLRHVDTVLQAASGEETLEVVDRHQPHLLILDLRMPRGNGLAVLRGLADRDPSPLVIVLTNYADESTRAEVMQAGASYFFDKSAEFEEMLATVEGLLADWAESDLRS